MFWNVLESSGKFWDVLWHSISYSRGGEIMEGPGMFWNVLESSGMFWDVLWRSISYSGGGEIMENAKK